MFNMSNGVLNPRHFLGRLLISISASVSLSSVTLAKSIFLEKNSRSKPLLFSLDSRCYSASAKYINITNLVSNCS